jgi:UDP-N-acetylglucosamine acyltransferase
VCSAGKAVLIHPSAIVDPGARLASNVTVGPWSAIGPDVEIDEGTVIGPHVVVKGPTRIGKNNRIYQFASVGEDCQDKKYAGEPTKLVIGDNNIIRESCTLHRGTVQDQGITRVGNNNLLMVNVHVAHDVVLGNDTTIANNVAIAGHVQIDDFAILGGMTAVHQFCRIGAHSICGVASVVLKDVPAYVVVSGNSAAVHGLNLEGLRRRDFSKPAIKLLQQAYRIVFRQGLTVQAALKAVHELDPQVPELAIFAESIAASTRGIVR